MSKYGIENVRGGSFCQIELSKENINTIEKMLNSSNNNCYICGNNNHFAAQCETIKSKKEKESNSDCNMLKSKIKNNMHCTKCGLNGHNQCKVSDEDLQNIIKYRKKIDEKTNKQDSIKILFNSEKKEKLNDKIELFTNKLLGLEEKYKYNRKNVK